MNYDDRHACKLLMSSVRETLTLLVKGGLGNQLFQLGAALEVATRTGRTVALSTPAYAFDRKRRCHAAVLYPELARLPAWREWVSAPLVLDWVARQPMLSNLVFNDMHVPAMDTYRADWHAVSGYFQHVKFSERVANRLDAHLRSVAPVAEAPYIAVHVRRTDFLRIETLRAEYEQLMRDYYRPAIERAIACNGNDCPVVVISDDPAGALVDLATVLGPRASRLQPGPAGSTVWQDLALLARATTLVCSNSTFCWWAARLRRDNLFMPAPWIARERARPGYSFELALESATLIG